MAINGGWRSIWTHGLGNNFMKSLLKKRYNLDVTSIEKSTVGAGSDTYFAACANGKYVVKFPSVSEINNPVRLAFAVYNEI